MSDREQWQRARRLFDELVELDGGPRRSRLEQIGVEDPALGQAVARLLESDPGSEAALQDYSLGAAASTPAIAIHSRDPLGVIGHTVSHFRVKDYLAAGGMGVVYRAEDLQLGRAVALKFPLPDQQLERSLKERFINEARSAAALDHPNLCSVYEIAESEHGVFLAMPLYAGETLKDRIAREGAMQPDIALAIVQQVATGLASAHAAGIIHRDLKPGNVMLLPDGTVKVLDFGLAKIRDVSLTASQRTFGTIGYVAPEQIRGGRVDARTDLWSIGVVLYEMLTGKPPFRGEHEVSIMHAILHKEPPPSGLTGGLSPQLDDVILMLLQKDADDRYPSTDALLADIAALRSGTALPHRTPFWRRTPWRRHLRPALLPAAAGVALLVIGGVIWNAYRRDATAGSKARARGGTVAPLKFVNNTAVVSTSAELIAALDPANAGRRIRIRAGAYDISQPLTVPNGMTLEGEGVMLFSPAGQPSGFADGPRTTLRMAANIGGDVLTLGDKVTVRNVEILDMAGRSGNVVAVMSRRPADRISATIIESVIVNPNPLTLGAGGPLGRGLLVITRNPNMGADPRPDEGAMLAVRMLRSVIRSPSGGGGFFAFNFAANGRISLEISRSVIGGSSEANGGVSRTDAVHDSEVRITSRDNLYRNEWTDHCAATLLGWNLTGGSGAPIPLRLPETARNRLVVRSENDRIDGFTVGVLATGSRRFFPAPLNAAPRDNHIDLLLVGTTISTPSCVSPPMASNTAGMASGQAATIADFQLIGAWAQSNAFGAGMGNTVRVDLRGVTGSGTRLNRYEHAGAYAGPLSAERQGTGNRLEIVGDSLAFTRTNRGIDPVPRAAFFTRGQ